MQLIERHSTAVYKAPAGTIPVVPPGETADRVQINVDGVQFIWKRNNVGSYYRYAGPIGWLTVGDFTAELLGDMQEAQAHG